MKKNNYLLYAFFLIFVVGGVAFYLLFVDDGVPNVDETKKDNYKFSVEYTKVPMDNVFVYKSETELKLKKSLLECPNKGVKADAELAWYNTPELFIEEET